MKLAIVADVTVMTQLALVPCLTAGSPLVCFQACAVSMQWLGPMNVITVHSECTIIRCSSFQQHNLVNVQLMGPSTLLCYQNCPQLVLPWPGIACVGVTLLLSWQSFSQKKIKLLPAWYQVFARKADTNLAESCVMELTLVKHSFDRVVASHVKDVVVNL